MLYKDLTGVRPEILQAVERMGFTEMTEVQEKTIPVMMAGHDVIAKAPTGTGKTCAFGIPIIERIDPGRTDIPRRSSLAPTRELAQQIAGGAARSWPTSSPTCASSPSTAGQPHAASRPTA